MAKPWSTQQKNGCLRQGSIDEDKFIGVEKRAANLRQSRFSMQPFQQGAFTRVGIALKCGSKGVLPWTGGLVSLRGDSTCKMLGHAKHEAIVEHGEGLQRSQRFVATIDQNRRICTVQCGHPGIGDRAHDEAIDGSSMTFGIVGVILLVQIMGRVIIDEPEERKAWTAALQLQLATDRKDAIADGFRIELSAIHSP